MSRDYEVCARLEKVESVEGVEWSGVCVKVENVLIRRGDDGVGETVGGRW